MEDLLMRDLLLKAKNNDSSSKEEIIKMYYPLIIKEAKTIYLKNKSFEDIVQIGVINLLHVIDVFDLSKNVDKFPSYALWAIKNGYKYLCRSQIKYNSEFSLNNVNEEGSELGDSIIDENINVEDTVIKSAVNENLHLALEKLDDEERNLINFLYIYNDKPNLSRYCALKEKDYYYCCCLKKRALEKLKNMMINFY
ncbi:MULTISPECIES: sigma-70 family RNA polymerase sigma factor [Clostridium]|uniref:sigma-70 family RNA polymerase sigma factor n=1 Tax=Clostridium TaxID=1485 RepID=UPI000DD0420A|nr:MULTISPECIES: sigma-70 family RNA polymerase sigma factor [Clostridium]MDU1278000.1 sigma-70 family RNA polymerase sigma factor [Clostridium sp.]MDU2155635.1 sigma-70 family RNA polymerase sigma factor [Clostridium sp.]MDU3350151.1 sigma-70 family RNA polymerase sigma factor [Clostridium sp.]MDU3408894.1 sigma-70 family RNA polymerase sigma factor [Clostridium sp.]MDU3526232.1 sigma-70 family RNA polymerase sigma factor [Clostridium sp.]